MPDTDTEPDVAVRDEGTIVLLTPVTEAAKEWFELNVDQGGARWGIAYVVEHRFVEDILVGAQANGLRVGGAK